jgi:hypothetical protein
MPDIPTLTRRLLIIALITAIASAAGALAGVNDNRVPITSQTVGVLLGHKPPLDQTIALALPSPMIMCTQVDPHNPGALGHMWVSSAGASC